MSDCTYESAIRELCEAQERISEKNQRINELGEENVRLKKELEIRKSGTERWLPCPDHRDKVDYRSACPECQIEQRKNECRLTLRTLERLGGKIETELIPRATVAAALRELRGVFELKAFERKDYYFIWEVALDELDATIAALGLEPDAFDALIASRPASFQSRVKDWILECFGKSAASNTIERNHRFLEESLELVQALGCTRLEAHRLVDYVFDRASGEPGQEVGGVMITLAALCSANSLDMDAEGEKELQRVWGKIEQIRTKQAEKPRITEER